ncbi:MAG: dTMP kinase [Candidatus Eisenbacteria bacterium]|uniref:Thymidylate kinase n=1 Tax=Eiseniibacteriota bacterium TaxID=2212470 RepID=A0A538TKF3_UNCEI|nr:MAG: dTMP kinase [Candidatus Eisenbacteria bacterium]
MQRLLLTLEGIEGSGKSTQAQRLKAFLDSRGIPSILTREPGGSPLGERIREMILTPGKEPLTPEAEVLLFLAARAQHVRRIIGPALDKGEVVICDRFTDATLAYQGGNGTISDELLRSLNRWATGAISPTRTYLIDVPVDVGLARAKRRRAQSAPDRFESEGAPFFEAVRKRYLEIARSESERFVVLRGTDPEEVVAHQIQKDVDSLLSGRTHNPSR